MVKGARPSAARAGLRCIARRGFDETSIMRELLRTNDPVTLSWVQALLNEAGIGCTVLDSHTSIIEGSIGAIPRRVMVPDEDLQEARRLIAEAVPHELP